MLAMWLFFWDDAEWVPGEEEEEFARESRTRLRYRDRTSYSA
jgi:hypothetical protein